MAILRALLYLALTLFLMGILIFVHELGHYLTARACRVTIYEFSLGMGKRLAGFTSKKTGIQYSLRLFPIGGYVSMAGEDEDKEGEENDPNAFNKKNPWQRLLILVAGAAMNVLTGALAMLILVSGMTLAGYKLPPPPWPSSPPVHPATLRAWRRGIASFAWTASRSTRATTSPTRSCSTATSPWTWWWSGTGRRF